MNANVFAVFGSSSILVTTFPEYHRTPRGRIIKLDKRPGRFLVSLSLSR